MVFIGIGAVLALLLAVLALRAKARHERVLRLIRQTPVTTIADLVQASTAHADSSTRTHAAVQSRVVAREPTRLTAPITGSSCVGYMRSAFSMTGVRMKPPRITSRTPSGCGGRSMMAQVSPKWCPTLGHHTRSKAPGTHSRTPRTSSTVSSRTMVVSACRHQNGTVPITTSRGR